MAFALLSHVVADLTLGKPALSWLASSSTVRDSLAALKLLADDVTEISIWDCSGSHSDQDFSQHLGAATRSSHVSGRLHSNCRCVGKICMQKLIGYLASNENLSNLSKALDAPVSSLLGDTVKSAVRHIDPEASLLEALELINEGAQNLVVPILGRVTLHGRHHEASMLSKHARTRNRLTSPNITIPKDHDGQEYCWLTQEDVLRFLLGSIRVFSPLPMMSIKDLEIIRTNVRMVGVEEDAISALEKIREACDDMTAVAVVENIEGKLQLAGDISCAVLQACNETAALALATLSAGEFLVYVRDCHDPPDVLVELIRARVHEKLGGLKADQHHIPLSSPMDARLLLHSLDVLDGSSSEEDESGAESPTGPHDLRHKWHSGHIWGGGKGYITRNRSGPIFCNPNSSLIAVLLQALAHRESHVWVVGEDDTLQGMVTFSDILLVMLSYVNVF